MVFWCNATFCQRRGCWNSIPTDSLRHLRQCLPLTCLTSLFSRITKVCYFWNSNVGAGYLLRPRNFPSRNLYMCLFDWGALKILMTHPVFNFTRLTVLSTANSRPLAWWRARLNVAVTWHQWGRKAVESFCLVLSSLLGTLSFFEAQSIGGRAVKVAL